MSHIGDVLDELNGIVKERKASPREGSYTTYLFTKGVDKICKKIGEEATEVVIAAKNGARDEIVYEISDLLYHLNVLMVEEGVAWSDVYQELKRRRS